MILGLYNKEQLSIIFETDKGQELREKIIEILKKWAGIIRKHSKTIHLKGEEYQKETISKGRRNLNLR